MPWPQTGATQYYTWLGLPFKNRAIKGLVVGSVRDIELLKPAKWSGPRLLSAVP